MSVEGNKINGRSVCSLNRYFYSGYSFSVIHYNIFTLYTIDISFPNLSRQWDVESWKYKHNQGMFSSGILGRNEKKIYTLTG